jgi:MFS transporter, FHS family, Na+ dependent glucose transporter 1
MTAGALQLRNTFGYYALFICLCLGMAIVGPTLSLLACQVGASTDAMGWLFFAGSVGYTVGTLAGGKLFDRVKRGNALLGGAELVAAGLLALLPFVRELSLFLAIVFCRGALEGMVNTGANTLLLWTHREKASPFINGLHFCFGVGAFVAPLVVAGFIGPGGAGSPEQLCAAAPAIGYKGAFWTVAAFAAAASLFVLSLSGSPDPAEHVARAKEARSASRVHYLPIAVAAVYLFAYVGGEISFGSWIATYAAELGVADVQGAALLTSAFWFSFTVGRLVSIPVAVRFTPRQVIPVALAPCLVVSGLLVVLPLSGPLLWTAAIALGFCLAPLWPSGYTLAGQVVALTGFSSALVLLGDSFGGMVLPSLTGRIMDLSKAGGPRALAASLPLLVFVSLLACLVTYLLLAALARRRGAAAAGPG